MGSTNHPKAKPTVKLLKVVNFYIFQQVTQQLLTKITNLATKSRESHAPESFMKKLALFLIVANTGFAMLPADAKDAGIPTHRIQLDQKYEIPLGERGFRVVVELPDLNPGWYEIIEEGLDDALPIASNRYFENEDNSKLLGFYVTKGLSQGVKRFAQVTNGGTYEFTEIVRSRENFLEIEAPRFDPSKWTSHGGTMGAAQFEGFPDCAFVDAMPKAGTLLTVRFRLNRVDDFNPPQSLIDRISGATKFH